MSKQPENDEKANNTLRKPSKLIDMCSKIEFLLLVNMQLLL